MEVNHGPLHDHVPLRLYKQKKGVSLRALLLHGLKESDEFAPTIQRIHWGKHCFHTFLSLHLLTPSRPHERRWNGHTVSVPSPGAQRSRKKRRTAVGVYFRSPPTTWATFFFQPPVQHQWEQRSWQSFLLGIGSG